MNRLDSLVTVSPRFARLGIRLSRPAASRLELRLDPVEGGKTGSSRNSNLLPTRFRDRV